MGNFTEHMLLLAAQYPQAQFFGVVKDIVVEKFERENVYFGMHSRVALPWLRGNHNIVPFMRSRNSALYYDSVGCFGCSGCSCAWPAQALRGVYSREEVLSTSSPTRYLSHMLTEELLRRGLS